MFGRSFKVASIGGIAIEIHPSWLIILGLLSFTLSNGFFPEFYEGWSTTTYWVVGVTAALLLFVTVLIHELAHAVVAIRRGLPVPKITLFIFGGVSHLSRSPASAGEEFAIAAAGPATSLVIAILSGAAWLLLESINTPQQITAVLIYIAFVNTALAVFNIIPGFPLDGGRVFRSIVWRRTKSFRRATRIAAGTGEMVGYGMMGLGVFFLLTGNAFQGLWLGFIGWFLIGAARGEAQSVQLEGLLRNLKARDVMREEWSTVIPGASIQHVVDEYMIGLGERAVVVANDGNVLGILSVSDIRKTPREAWGNTSAQGLMTPRERVVTVTAETPAVDVLALIGQRALNQVPVLQEGRMIGIITRGALVERVQLVESLTPDDAAAPTSR
jgi:Zn-dependent protease/CBS domain-containing protein